MFRLAASKAVPGPADGADRDVERREPVELFGSRKRLLAVEQVEFIGGVMKLVTSVGKLAVEYRRREATAELSAAPPRTVEARRASQ